MKKLITIITILCGIFPIFAIEKQMSADDLKDEVSKTEKEYNIPSGMLDAVITLESNYAVKAVNPKDYSKEVFITSYGLGQITQSSAKYHCNLLKKDIFNPTKNINCAAKILKYQLDRFEGSILDAVSSYNIGTPCVCNGKFYVRKYEKGNNKNGSLCFKTDTTDSHNGKSISCKKKDINKYLNDSYIKTFLEDYKNLHPDSFEEFLGTKE